METVLNVLHVLSAVFLVGPMAVLPMVAMRDLRSGAGAQVTSLAKSTVVFSLASLAALVFGFGLQGMAGIPFGRPWIWISLVLYLAALALNLFVVVPAMRQASTDAAGTGGVNRRPRIAMSSGAVSLLLLVVVILMVWKP